MVDPHDRYRKPKDVGSESPASGEAKRQSIDGTRGGPRQSKPGSGGKQPAQESGRRAKRHEQRPAGRKHFEPESDPSLQGTGEPGPEQIKERSGLQGISARSGSHRSHGERTEERAQQGPPAHGHTRRGRQRVPGRPERPDPDEQRD